jgi:hypothetical protein
MRVQRHAHGSVRFDKRRRTWNYLWYEAGKRRSKLIGTKQQYSTKAAAWKAVDIVRASVQQTGTEPTACTMQVLVEHYRVEKMPTRYSTRRSYEMWLKNHILPRRGTVRSRICRRALWKCGLALLN